MTSDPREPGPDFLAIVGATATGKTALSIEVAEILDVEVISMDSRQVYRGMDIGTAKATPAQRARVPHHGLDLVEPDQAYSAGTFARDAREWIEGIRERGRVPLLVGGTGFFLRALTDPLFEEPEVDAARRGRLRRYLGGLDRRELERWTRRLDPERAELAIAGGPQRMGRTLEIALLSGRPLSEWHRRADPSAAPRRGPVVVLDMDRDELYRRIDDRVEEMVERGLVAEVEGLLRMGFGPEDPGMSGTGYREVAGYLGGEWSLEEAVDRIQRATRAYARRQLTWFRNQLPADAVRLDALRPTGDLVRAVEEVWRSVGSMSGHAPGER